jgi:hypothetical protein
MKNKASIAILRQESLPKLKKKLAQNFNKGTLKVLSEEWQLDVDKKEQI